MHPNEYYYQLNSNLNYKFISRDECFFFYLTEGNHFNAKFTLIHFPVYYIGNNVTMFDMPYVIWYATMVSFQNNFGNDDQLNYSMVKTNVIITKETNK